jgi:hypothetical protein
MIEKTADQVTTYLANDLAGLANDLAGDRITVSAVFPGVVYIDGSSL